MTIYHAIKKLSEAGLVSDEYEECFPMTTFHITHGEEPKSSGATGADRGNTGGKDGMRKERLLDRVLAGLTYLLNEVRGAW